MALDCESVIKLDPQRVVILPTYEGPCPIRGCGTPMRLCSASLCVYIFLLVSSTLTNPDPRGQKPPTPVAVISFQQGPSDKEKNMSDCLFCLWNEFMRTGNWKALAEIWAVRDICKYMSLGVRTGSRYTQRDPPDFSLIIALFSLHATPFLPLRCASWNGRSVSSKLLLLASHAVAVFVFAWLIDLTKGGWPKGNIGFKSVL